jgi:uncharacterized membrane protein (DUF485 family)
MAEASGLAKGRASELPREAPVGNGGPPIDWVAAESTPEFRELVATKRRFVLPATVFFLAWFFGFILLAGYAPDFMGNEFLVDGLTVGYVLALSQFVMVWGLGWLYLRTADRKFDPLAEKAAQRAIEISGPATGNGRTRRFERTGATEDAARAESEVTPR